MDNLIPNTFQSPNFIIDSGIMALLDGEEVKCLFACQRKILGWEKKRITRQDRISISQICNMTGLGRPTVVKKMVELDKANLLHKIDNGDGNDGALWELNTGQLGDVNLEYLETRNIEKQEKINQRMATAREIKASSQSHKPVNAINQLSTLTTSGQCHKPLVVNGIDTQNPLLNPNKPTIAEAKNASASTGGNSKPSQRQRSNREIAIDHLQKHFSDKSGIPLESDFKARNKLWRGPLGRLLDAVDCDVGKTQRLIDLAVDKMRSDGLTFSDPNSIYKVAVAKIPEIGQNGRKVVVV